MTPNILLIESKWAFNKKIGVRFRGNLVARGYTQIPGVYFTYNYSPVVTDVILRIILLMQLINKWYSHTLDIETASYM